MGGYQLYHSPGLRDGVSAEGCACACGPAIPKSLEREGKCPGSSWQGINPAGRRSVRLTRVAGKPCPDAIPEKKEEAATLESFPVLVRFREMVESFMRTCR